MEVKFVTNDVVDLSSFLWVLSINGYSFRVLTEKSVCLETLHATHNFTVFVTVSRDDDNIPF